jgi:hypothetical protein
MEGGGAAERRHMGKGRQATGGDYGWWGSSTSRGMDVAVVRAVRRCMEGDIGHRQVCPGGF